MRAARTVTLYSRPGCHLCEAALGLLRELAPPLGYAIEVADIEQDEALHRRFMLEIPVIEIDGEIVAQAPIRRAALEAALREHLG